MVDAPSSAFAANPVLGAVISPPRFLIGEVVQRAFGPLGHNRLAYLAITAIGIFLPFVALVLLVRWLAPIASLDVAQWSLFGALFVVPFAWFFYAAMSRAMMTALLGEPVSLIDALRGGLVFLPLVGLLNILQVLAIAVGFVLLIVPGVIAMAALWPLPVIAVTERTGPIGSFRRALELTNSHRWSLLGTILLAALLTIPIRILVYVVEVVLKTALAPDDAQLWSSLTITPLGQGAQQVLTLAVLVSAYYELRRIKGGIGPSSTAAVFD